MYLCIANLFDKYHSFHNLLIWIQESKVKYVEICTQHKKIIKPLEFLTSFIRFHIIRFTKCFKLFSYFF